MKPIDLERLGRPGRIVENLAELQLTRKPGSLVLVSVETNASRHDIEELRNVLERMNIGSFLIVPANLISNVREMRLSEVEQVVMLLNDVLQGADAISPDPSIKQQADKIVDALTRRPRLFREVLRRVRDEISHKRKGSPLKLNDDEQNELLGKLYQESI